MKQAAESKELLPVEAEYARCVGALQRTGILMLLPQAKKPGVMGIDGNEYPLPTKDQVAELVERNAELVARKVPQGFQSLEMTPLAMPAAHLLEHLKSALIKHAVEGKIYRTRRSQADPLVPVRVNKEKQVWVWETLRERLDTDEVVYFPREHSGEHGGMTKLQVIEDKRICAVPGWSVGLVERMPLVPLQGQGKVVGGRKQFELGSSARDFLKLLNTDAYFGETGKTIEDYVTRFLTRLEGTNEISHDREDNNALWFLGQYVKYVEKVKSDLVPTGWWHHQFGRARVDAHRPGNKLCTKSWGIVTTVRLRGT